MPRVKVAAFSISIDGYGAGPRQDLKNPLGVRGTELHGWFRHTDVFKKMQGQSGGSKGTDNDMALQSFENVGAWILGRNMFGPVRGPWVIDPSTGDLWNGWWGDTPPYHTPVFVLTHHARAPLEMKGGTIAPAAGIKNEVAHAAFTRRTRGTLFGNETVAAGASRPPFENRERWGSRRRWHARPWELRYGGSCWAMSVGLQIASLLGPWFSPSRKERESERRACGRARL
ncbi:MAG: hypothetical protein WA477_17990 [Candidatus Sulfotelmatobacter sp.]